MIVGQDSRTIAVGRFSLDSGRGAGAFHGGRPHRPPRNAQELRQRLREFERRAPRPVELRSFSMPATMRNTFIKAPDFS